MPVCFQLINKKKPEEGPVVLTKVDEKMCEFFGEPIDEKYWFYGWYGTVGELIAGGRTWNELREIFKDDDMYTRIVNWLDENYTTNTWRENKY